MKNKLCMLRQGTLICAMACLAWPAAAQESDSVLFVGDGASYLGRYGLAEKSLSVVIDGLPYKGYFSDQRTDAGAALADGAPVSGRWGRAFLFASSAKVMQCALDTGFPNVSGRCHDAEGRPFALMPPSKR